MDRISLKQLETSLASFDEWKQSFGAWETDSVLTIDQEKAESVFTELVQRLGGNYPFHHPAYAGQMLKPPHPLTWAAYALAMSINPNNHALDGGPPSSEMEKEVIREFSHFYGFGDNYLGHLTASGTIANLEALWVARESHPDKGVAYSSNSHYTHERMCSVLGISGFKMDVLEGNMPDLESIDTDKVGTIVVTLGTTGLGEVEPLHRIVPWAKEKGIRIHVDCAYGGFFHAIRNSEAIESEPWNSIHEVDSIVVDPHKHGMQPYGCGCVLFSDPNVARFYLHDSPYTYYTSDELHLGEISLECSRAGAAAVALWATIQMFPLAQDHGFGPVMMQCRKAALNMYELLEKSEKLSAYKSPELDIIAYFPSNGTKTSEISTASQHVFDEGMKQRTFYLSLYKIPSDKFVALHPQYEADEDYVTVLRSVLMRPEQAAFVKELVKRIEDTINL